METFGSVKLAKQEEEIREEITSTIRVLGQEKEEERGPIRMKRRR